MKKLLHFVLTIPLSLFFINNNYAQTPIIVTVAGNGTTGFTGDGGPATNAGLNNVASVAVDGAGNFYLSDGGHSCLRKVSSTSGTINNFAGTPTVQGYSGDGGPATAAKVFNPTGLTISPVGELVFCDSGNACLRKVSYTSGTISSIAGNESLGAGYSGDGGPATAAQISNSCSICFDGAGNMYIADGGNSCLRKVSSTSGTISFIAGTPTMAGFYGDGGPATLAKLNNPTAVAVDTAGNIYIVDGGNSCIRMISSATGVISTIAGTPTVAGFGGDGASATAALLNNPSGIAVTNAGKIFISDKGNNRMRVITPAGMIKTVAGTDTAGFNGDGLCSTAELDAPQGVCLDAYNNCYIADRYNNRVRYINYTLFADLPDKPSMSMNIKPNPSTGLFTLNITTLETSEIQFYITNILGKKVKEISGRTNQSIEILLNEPPGVYLINANTKSGDWSGKIVIDW